MAHLRYSVLYQKKMEIKKTIQGVKILSASPRNQDDLVTRGSERIANYILRIHTTFIRYRWRYSVIDNISSTNHAKALLDTLNSIVVVRYIRSGLETWARLVFINTRCPKHDCIPIHTKEKYSSKYYKHYTYLFGANIANIYIYIYIKY